MSSVDRTIMEWIQQACACRCAGAMLSDETDLIADGVLDSLNMLQLVAFIEEHFGIVMPLEEFVPENFATPKAVMAMVRRQIPALA
jgi:acyl carrier protein